MDISHWTKQEVSIKGNTCFQALHWHFQWYEALINLVALVFLCDYFQPPVNKLWNKSDRGEQKQDFLDVKAQLLS